jgi:hypothetical protein
MHFKEAFDELVLFRDEFSTVRLHPGLRGSPRPGGDVEYRGSARSPGRRTAHSPPGPAPGGAPPPADAAGSEVSLGEPFEGGLRQLRAREQPFQRRVLPLELLQPLGIIGLQPAELVAPPVVRRLGDLQLRQTSATSLPSANS